MRGSLLNSPAKKSVYCEQVLINLLNNSADAIEKIENKWITVKLFKESNQAVLEITDCGPGIPDAVLEKLMQPFFTTKPVGKGTGLGLSISRGIIQAHKGTFEYKKGCQNTTFVITIPLADSQPMAA
jgi:C4-dicarboxylate-specific signal transduction histidine kinase